LATLDLSDNAIGGHVGEPGCRALAAALEANTTITAINLTRTGLSVECTEILAPAIGAMKVLASLNLSGNEFKAEGAKHIARVLPKW
jgi:Ran GTPase-activating protein (RanGAP) involved in mRNA processing and transport